MKQAEIIAELEKRNLDTKGRRVEQLERLIDAILPPGSIRPSTRAECKKELEKRGICCNRNRFVMLETLVLDLTGLRELKINAKKVKAQEVKVKASAKEEDSTDAEESPTSSGKTKRERKRETFKSTTKGFALAITRTERNKKKADDEGQTVAKPNGNEDFESDPNMEQKKIENIPKDKAADEEDETETVENQKERFEVEEEPTSSNLNRRERAREKAKIRRESKRASRGGSSSESGKRASCTIL